MKKHRKLLTSAFHFQILPKFFKIFESNADIFCENLANHEGKEAFDASQYITLYTLDNICGKYGKEGFIQLHSRARFVRGKIIFF